MEWSFVTIHISENGYVENKYLDKMLSIFPFGTGKQLIK